MRRTFFRGSVALAALSLAAVASAQSANDAKSEYNLFNPVPRELMRPLSADRPDLTESPHTVDAGHFQVEADVIRYGYDRYHPDGGNRRAESWAVAPANFKAGLLNNVDLQLFFENYQYTRVKDRDAGTTETRRGFGDIQTRLKINLWGNDGGTTALALMPWAKFPTNQDDLGNDAFEGGLIIPLGVELPRGWGMGLMTEFDWMEDGDGSGHHAEFVNTVVFGHSIVGPLAGYAEFFSLVSAESDSDWAGVIGLGLTYGVTEDIQLDGGVNLGVTRAAEDYTPFVGFTWRF